MDLVFLSLEELRDFPGGPVVEDLLCHAGDAVPDPGWGTRDLQAMEFN